MPPKPLISNFLKGYKSSQSTSVPHISAAPSQQQPPANNPMTHQHDKLDALMAGLGYSGDQAPASSAPINWGQSGNTNPGSGNIFLDSHPQSYQALRVPVPPDQPTWVPQSSVLGLAPQGWQGPTRDLFVDAAQEPTPQWIQRPSQSTQWILGHHQPSAPSDWMITTSNHNPFENGYDIRKAPPSKDIWQ